MNSNSYSNFYIVQIVNEIKDAATYVKNVPMEMYLKEPAFYHGMQYAYSKVLENVKEYIECNEELDINDFNLTDKEIEEIIHLRPNGVGNG